MHAADPKDGEAFNFGYILGMQMWEKNAENMQKKVPWLNFEKVRKTKPDWFYEYSFGNDYYVMLPGFGSEKVNGNQQDGSCLWTHLGIKPEKMYTLSAKTVEVIQQKVLERPDSKDDYQAIAMELIAFLDPKENIVKEGTDPFTGLAELTRQDDKVRENWLKNIQQHGGTDFMYNEKWNAMRPLNSDVFFQGVADTLNINITIFKEKDLSSIEVAREFIVQNAEDTLYLLMNEYGTHYDILTPRGEDVSEPIFNEMMFYLNFKNNNEERYPSKKEKLEKLIRKENKEENIREAGMENEGQEDQDGRNKIRKESNSIGPEPIYLKEDERDSVETLIDGKPKYGYSSNKKTKQIKKAEKTAAKPNPNKIINISSDEQEDEGWSVEALVNGNPKYGSSTHK